jgi:uncharacterized phage-associated protein
MLVKEGSMASPFSERKATEAAAHLLHLRGGRMHFLKLLKLLYIADREALHRWGIPISHDNYVSMDHGPVLSQTYNLIRDGGSRFWSEHISAPFDDYEIRLIQDKPEAQKLSPAEERLLDEIYSQYGHANRWDLVEKTHKFPEWQDPHGSSIPISLREILHGLGEPEEEIEAIVAELGYEQAVAERLEVA